MISKKDGILGTCASVALSVIFCCQASFSAADPAPGNANQTSQGRIAQLLSQNGARLPLKLQSLTPRMDNSLSKPVVLTGGIAKSGSFPQDWQGAWTGTVTIKVFQYNPLVARFDPAEFAQTESLMQPGTNGQVTFQFTGGRQRKIELQPAQVYFSRPAAANHYFFVASPNSKTYQPADNPSAPGPGWVRIGIVRPVSTPPFRYILHLGLFQPGVGVTGNSLSGRLLSDTVRTLAPDVIEQQVLTYESDLSRLTGSTGHAFSENDIQFTAEDADTLKVEAASVRYGPNGDFVDKVILDGEVRRDPNAMNPTDSLTGS